MSRFPLLSKTPYCCKQTFSDVRTRSNRAFLATRKTYLIFPLHTVLVFQFDSSCRAKQENEGRTKTNFFARRPKEEKAGRRKRVDAIFRFPFLIKHKLWKLQSTKSSVRFGKSGNESCFLIHLEKADTHNEEEAKRQQLNKANRIESVRFPCFLLQTNERKDGYDLTAQKSN